MSHILHKQVSIVCQPGTPPSCSELITSAALLDYIADVDLH
jgi:hypothetical protein